MTSLTAITGPTALTDDVLFALVAEGDRRAFAALYERTAPRVLGLVVQCLKDRAQAEEVTQEVFLELWQTAARFDSSKGRVLTWMLTMARRRAIDRVRASQSSRDRDLRVGIRDQVTDYDDVSETIEIRFENERVRRAMGSISALQREAIEFSYSGLLTQAEVAERLGVKVGTVKTRLRDGLIALRRALESDAA